MKSDFRINVLHRLISLSLPEQTPESKRPSGDDSARVRRGTAQRRADSNERCPSRSVHCDRDTGGQTARASQSFRSVLFSQDAAVCDGALDVFAAGTACRQAGLAARGQSLSLSQSAPMLRELTLVTHQFVPQSIAFLARSPMLPQLTYHARRAAVRTMSSTCRCQHDASSINGEGGEVVLVRHARRFANDARVAPRIMVIDTTFQGANDELHYGIVVRRESLLFVHCHGPRTGGWRGGAYPIR